MNTLGQTNLNNSSQIFISTINGQAIDVVNGLLGGWASGNGGSFATYDSLAGVEAYASGLTNSAGTAVVTYASASIIGATTGQNIDDTTTHTLTASTTANSLFFGANTITIGAAANSGTILTLNAGIYTNTTSATSITGFDATTALTVTPLLTLTVSSTTGLAVGETVTGQGIPAGTVVTSIVNGTTLTLSQIPSTLSPTSSLNMAAGETLTFSGTASTPTAGALAPNPYAGSTNPNAAADPSSPMTGPLANLYAFINSGTTVLNIDLVGPMNLVKYGAGVLTLAPIAPVAGVGFNGNTYTGATYVQQGTLTLSSPTAGLIAVPGNLIANNGIINFGTVIAGQIASTSNITLNGTSTFTLPIFTTPVSNTFASINFANTGGSAAPTFSLGTPTAQDTVILTGAIAITSQNDNFGFTPTISTNAATLTALQFSNAAPVINVLGIGDQISPGVFDTGASPIDLVISAPITSAGGTITKTGTGALVLSGANTFTTGFNLSNGTLIIGASSNPTVTTPVTGPVGTGTLTIGAGTTILSSANFTIANAVNVGGSFTFGGTEAVNSLTLAGPLSLGSNAVTITVTDPLVTGTISGFISDSFAGSGSMIKNGGGTLLLTANNAPLLNWSGANAIQILDGVLQISGTDNALGMAPASFVANNIVLDGGVLSDITTSASLNANRGITLGGANTFGAIDSTTSGVAFTILSAITGNGGLVKTGLGQVVLAGTDSYLGGTTVAAGVLRLQNSAALGSNAGSTLVFPGASLELDGTSPNGSLAIGAQALTLNGTGVSGGGALHSTGGNNSSAGAITLGSATLINSEVTGNTLTLTGGITGGGFPLTVGGSGNTSITTTGISGISQLIKNDDGTLTLGVSNTYSGGTSINAGTVAIQNGGSLGSGTVVVASGASLNLQNGITVNNSLTISGNGLGAAGQNGALASSGLNNFQGTITLGANATISSDSGLLNLNNGAAITGSGFTLTLAGAGNGSITDPISVGSGGLIKNGSGTWTLQVSSSYSGSTTVNAGTLSLGSGSNQSSAVIVNGGTLNTTGNGYFGGVPSLTLGGGTFTFSGSGASTYSEFAQSLTLTPGTVSGITINNQNATGTTLSLGSAITHGADSILDITYTAGQGTGAAVATSGAPAGSGAPTGTNKIFGYMLVTDASGTGLGMLNGSNQIVRFNSQTTAATLTSSSNSATTDYSSFNTIYTGGLLDWSGGATPIGPRAVNSLTIDTTNASGSIFLGGDSASANPAVLTIASGALVFQGPASETIYGGQIGASNSELDIHQLGAGTLTIGSVLVSAPASLQTGIVNSGSTISGLATTNGLFVGEVVTGSNIPVGDTIASITNGTTITLTNATTAASGGVITAIEFAPGSGSVVKDGSGKLVLTGPFVEVGNLSGATIGLSGLNGLGGTAGLYVGELVSGLGIAPGTTITSIGAGTVTLSTAATVSGNSSLTFGTQSSYTGGSYIDGGTVQAGAKNALSPNSTFVLANTAGALLDLNGFDQVVGGLSGGGASGGNLMLSNGATLTVGGGLSPTNVALNTNLSSVGVWNTYGGLVSGTGNLALTGGETLYLTNTGNSYSGFTNVLSGSLVINNMGELGTSSTTVTVAGVTGGQDPGGTLVLQGGIAGMTVNRNLDISGAGVGQNGNDGLSFVTIGNNTYTGIITLGSGTDTRVGFVDGTTIFSSTSTLNLGNNAGNEFLAAGAGNLIINGLVEGGIVGQTGFYRWSLSGIIGEIVLNNPNNDFITDVQISGGFLGVSAQGDLGAATDNSSVRGNGGNFDFRADPVNADFDLKTLYAQANTTIYVGRSVGGAGINQTITFGGAIVNGAVIGGFNDAVSNVTTTFGSTSDGSGNDGYGITFNAGSTPAAGLTPIFAVVTGNPTNITTNLNGLFTFNGSISTSDTTSRSDTLGVNGDLLLNGNLLNTVANDAIWNKTGVGALAITGIASTGVGTFNITNGTVAVNQLGAFNVALGGGVQIGAGTNGILNYLGASGLGSVAGTGETSARAFINSVTTANIDAVILADQQQIAANTSASPLVLTSSIAATGAVSKNFYLGGYNNTVNTAVINVISGVIQDNSATNITSLIKGGNGTWLYSPNGSTYANATVAAPTTLPTSAATANGSAVLSFTSTAGLSVGQFVTGAGIAANSFILSIVPNTSVTLSQNTTAVASAATIGFAGEAATTTGSGAANTNTLALTSAAGLVVGETVAGVNVPTGSIITAITGNTVFLNTNIATAVATESLYFGSIGVAGAAGAGAGESFTGNVTVTGGILQIQPTASSGNNGSLPLNATGTSTTTNNLVFTTDPLTGNGYAGGTFQLLGTPSGVTGALTTNVGSLTLTSGAATIVTTPTVGGGTPTLSFINTTPIVARAAGGGVVDFDPGVGANIQFITSPTLTNGIIGGYAYFTNSTTGAVDFAVVSGSTPFVVGAPTYAATGSFLNTGLPLTGSTSTVNYLNSASVTTTASETVNSLKLSGAQTVTLGGVLTIGTGGLLFDDTAGAATVASTSSVFTLGAAASELIVTVAGKTLSNALTISAPIGNTTASLTKAGSGTLIISGSNYFTGNVNIDEGMVQLSGPNATLGLITTAGNVTALRQGTVLDLNAAGPGGVVTIGGLTGAGTITNSGGGTNAASTLNIGLLGVTTSTPETFSGLLTNGGTGGAAVLNVTKNGSGTEFLNPLNGAFQSTGSSAGSMVLTGTTNTTAVTGLSSTTGLFVGEVVTGANILPGTSVAAINSLTNSVTLSQAATTVGSVSLDFGTNLSTLGTIGVNTYTGVTTVAQGILSVTSLANIGVNSGIGAGNGASNATNAASLVLGAYGETGILQYIGQNNSSFLTLVQSPSVVTNRLFTLAGSGGLDSSGGYGSSVVGAGTANNAAIWFNNTAPIAFSTPGAKTLTLQGNSSGDNEIDLKLIDNTIDASSLGVTKGGTGTWVLGNTNNTYSGFTTISGGVLRAQDAGENATTGVTTAPIVGSNILTLSTVLAGSNTQTTAGLSIGQSVSGIGIAPGTVITSILSGTQIQLSTTPSSVANGTSLTFGSINSLSPNSNLVLNGGVLESTGVFTRSLGTGADQLQWLSGTQSGGFAASSGSLIVAIGGLNSLTPLVFGTSSFTTGTFMLGSLTALADTTVLNPLDLNGAARTITVTDNTTVGTDIYNLAGVISGRTGSGLTLNGGTLLTISGANTYSGNTTVTGDVVVSSIGAGAASSAFGDATGTLLLGNATTTGAYLLYAGSGESTTRTINLNTTTAGNTIDASGSGALVLNSVVNSVAGAKTLTIRGTSTDANTINSALTDNGGALSIAKTDSGTWILNGASTFTGQVVVSQGWLAIGPTWGTVTNNVANPLGLNTSVGVGGSVGLGTAAGAPLALNNGGFYTLDPSGTTFGSQLEVVINTTNTVGGQYSREPGRRPLYSGDRFEWLEPLQQHRAGWRADRRRRHQLDEQWRVEHGYPDARLHAPGYGQHDLERSLSRFQ